MNDTNRPYLPYIWIGICDALPTASADMHYQLRALNGNGSRDGLYVCLYNGSAYEWADVLDVWDGQIGALTIHVSSTSALVVEDAGGVNQLSVDTINGLVKLESAADLVFYNGGVEVARIDGVAGAFTTKGAVTITLTSTASLSVKNGAGTNLFVVDSTNSAVTLRNETNFKVYSDDGSTEVMSIDGLTGSIQTDGTLTVDGDTNLGNGDGDLLTIKGHAFYSGSSPSITAGAAAGTSPTVAIEGTDATGMISVTTGTAPATGTLATITFAVAYSTANYTVSLDPANLVTVNQIANVRADQTNRSTTNFLISANPVLTASTAYKWYYTIRQYLP